MGRGSDTVCHAGDGPNSRVLPPRGSSLRRAENDDVNGIGPPTRRRADTGLATDQVDVLPSGPAKRAHQIRPASLSELEKLAAAMPERYGAMILLASWCALRFGELTELRRRDVEVDMDADRGE